MLLSYFLNSKVSQYDHKISSCHDGKLSQLPWTPNSLWMIQFDSFRNTTPGPGFSTHEESIQGDFQSQCYNIYFYFIFYLLSFAMNCERQNLPLSILLGIKATVPKISMKGNLCLFYYCLILLYWIQGSQQYNRNRNVILLLYKGKGQRKKDKSGFIYF